MSDAVDREESAMSAFARQVGRGFVYFLVLQYSLGIAVRMLLDRVAVTPSLGTAGVVSSSAVLVVAALLTNSATPPSYRRVGVFSGSSLVLGWAMDSAVGVGAGHIGALYPSIQTAFIWLGAFLLAYAVTFGMEWEPLFRPAAEEGKP